MKKMRNPLARTWYYFEYFTWYVWEFENTVNSCAVVLIDSDILIGPLDTRNQNEPPT